jgi:predicted site-specific integrase-resolvase
MSINVYLWGIIVLLVILAVVVRYLLNFMHWSVFGLLSRLKNPHKREAVVFYESKKCLRYLHKQIKHSRKSPELAEDIFMKMQQLLPIEGVLIKERTRLYNLLQHIRTGFFNASRYNRISQGNPRMVRQNISNTLTARFNTLINIHSKLDELDNRAKSLKAQIDTLLHLAEKYKTAQHYTKLAGCLKTAEKMQEQNIKLLKAIHNTERDLIVISKKLRQPAGIKNTYISPSSISKN